MRLDESGNLTEVDDDHAADSIKNVSRSGQPALSDAANLDGLTSKFFLQKDISVSPASTTGSCASVRNLRTRADSSSDTHAVEYKSPEGSVFSTSSPEDSVAEVSVVDLLDRAFVTQPQNSSVGASKTIAVLQSGAGCGSWSISKDKEVLPISVAGFSGSGDESQDHCAATESADQDAVSVAKISLAPPHWSFGTLEALPAGILCFCSLGSEVFKEPSYPNSDGRASAAPRTGYCSDDICYYSCDEQAFQSGIRKYLGTVIDNCLSLRVYKALKVVGKGAFGHVFKCLVREGGPAYVAVKRTLVDIRYECRERQILALLGCHPSIVRCYDIFLNAVNSIRQSPEVLLDQTDSHAVEGVAHATRGRDLAAHGSQAVEGQLEQNVQKEISKNARYLHFVFEYLPGTLDQALRTLTARKRRLPPIYVKYYAYQIARAMLHMHALNICHRDLKPQNILFNPETQELRICDFGSSKVLSAADEGGNAPYVCSRFYRAPELIFGSRGYTVAVDLWSYGCILAELLLGRKLFRGQSSMDQLIEIIRILGTPSVCELEAMNENYEQLVFPSINARPWTEVLSDPQAADLVGKILRFDPRERLNAGNILSHSFFDELRVPGFCLTGAKPRAALFHQRILYGFTAAEVAMLNAEQKRILLSEPNELFAQ